MKKLFLCVAFSSLSCLMTACGPMYKTTYEYHPPENQRGRMCLNHCLDIKNECRAICNNHNDVCKDQAMQRAQMDFESYQHAQRETQQPITKTVNDFYNPWGCSESCHCEQQYNQCYSNCGGEVVPVQTCVAFCK